MGILLAILSVIGTIFLWILRIVFLILLLVFLLLICPIRYRVHTVFGEKWLVEGKVSYLLSAFSVKSVYSDGSLQSKVHLFGMDVFRILEWWKKKRTKKRSGKKIKTTDAVKRKEKTDSATDNQTKSEQSEKEAEDKQKASDTKNVSEQLIATEKQSDDNEEQVVEKHDNGSSHAATKRRVQILRKCRMLLLKMQETVKKVKKLFKTLFAWIKKAKRRVDWLGDVRAFLKLENTKRMVCIFKDNVLHLWRKLKPKVIKGEVLFGTGDPCQTGQILGVAAMVYAAYGKGVSVTLDFEEKRLEGNLLIKGHINILTLLIIAIRILTSSEWDEFRHDMSQVKEAM